VNACKRLRKTGEYLEWFTGRSQLGESNDVTEENGDFFKFLSLYGAVDL